MRKIFTLFILLLLLPVTALAAGPNTVYVGGVALTGSSDGSVYATTNESGEVITNGADANNYNIKWDGSTLTLKNAYITNAAHGDSYLHPVEGAAIGVANSSGDAELTIQLESGNTIEDVSLGIWVYSSTTTTGNASLTITGAGNLTASGSSHGILVQSNSGDAALTIRNADVTAENSSYSGDGVTVRAGSSSSASLSVDGGSLTATGKNENGAGIRYTFGSSSSGSGTPSLTVSNSAIVKAINNNGGGIVTNSSTTTTVTPTVSGENGGIVFDKGTGTVYGAVTLQEDLEIGEGETLTIPQGASLTVPEGTTLTNKGTIVNIGGTLNGEPGGTIVSAPTITTESLPEGTVGQPYTATLEATGNNIAWSSSDLPTWLTLDASTGVITGTPTTAGTYNFTVKAENSAGSYSKELMLTVTAPTTYTITAEASPAEGGTVTVNGGTSSVSVEANSTVNLVATPNAGYRFTGWTSSNGGTFADASSVSTTFTMPANDVIVTAGFEQYYPVTSITLDKSELSLYTGNSETLTATIEPDNATNKNVTWATSDDTVVTVQATGNGTAIVTAVGEGTTTITVTTEDGGKKATCTVTVTHSMVHTPKKDATCTEDGNIEYWYCKNCDKYFSDENATEDLSDVVIPATGHHYVNGYCTKCGHRDPDYRPDPISYYNIYIEDVCDGVEVSTSKQVVREGGSVSVYVKKDTVNYTFDNFKVYYKRSYYGGWEELKEGTQPGEYPIKNIWTHIYIKAQGAEEKEDPTGIESIEGVKVYTKDGSLYVQTPQREQVIIVSMSGAVVKNEEQIGLKQYHGLQPGIYIVRVGDRAYKLRLN